MILVIGYGVSGKAVMALLKKKGIQAVAVDKNPGPDALLDSADFPLDGIDFVVLSPGILPTHPLVLKAKERGLEVIGEMELALCFMENKAIGVTGSNGKTTTTLLITHVLKTAGIPARAVGNVGEALSTYLLNPNPADILVIELSSFQLETMRQKKLDLALYLNLSPNHLDRHASMEEYARVKANIQNCLKPGGKLFVSDQVWQLENHYLKDENVEIFRERSGAANVQGIAAQNVAAAKAVCLSLGVSEEQFSAALPMFEKPPHRIEWVAERDGIRYYNDSKATSVEAVLHALSCLEGPIWLLVGGVDKGASYLPWKSFHGKVKKIVAYGAASGIIQKELASCYDVQIENTLSGALIAAQKGAVRGDAIVLSPGCASYDQFRSYEHRGDEFKRLVREPIGVDP